MGVTPVVLDCDTGTDDAVAILLAALHPELELLGVTTVWGNHDVADTTDNTLRVLDLIGRGDAGGVAVHPGRNAPVRPRNSEIPTGRDDLQATLGLPPATSVAGGDAVEWIVETLRAATSPVAVVPTGPLTNIAAAVAADPRITEQVGRLVILGGAHREAGVTPYAERNVWCDPEAAHDVLAAGFRDVLMVTLDATFSAVVDAADAGRLRDTGTVAATTAADMIAQRIAWYERDDAMRRVGGAPLHDPLAVAALVDPDLLTVLRASVEVELVDEERYGATRFLAESEDRAGAVGVAVRADKQRYVDLLCKTLGAER